MEDAGNLDNMSKYELCVKASEFLVQAGYTPFGEQKKDVRYMQRKFERNMKTGAFSRNGSRRK